MPRKPQRVESFGPEMMAVLLRGATDGIKIELPYHRAIRFRQRLYQLRHAMAVEGHPKYGLVSRVRAAITWDETSIQTVRNSKQVPRPTDRRATVTVEVMPLDHEFTQALRDAGLDLKTAVADEQPGVSLDDFLKDLEENNNTPSKKSA